MNTMQIALVKPKRIGSYDVLMPACPVSSIFARLSGHENITKPVQQAMKELGYVLNVLPDASPSALRQVVQEARSV